MNKTFEFLLLALGMFLGSLLCGFAPACIAAKPQSVGVISLYGAGLLIGVSLLIIIPEGIRSMYLTSFNQMKQLSLSSGIGVNRRGRRSENSGEHQLRVDRKS